MVRSLARESLRILAWPVIIVGNGVLTWQAVQAGVAPAVVLAVSGVACLAASAALERVVPFRADWGPTRADTALHLHHVVWTELATQLVFRVALGALAIALGFSIGSVAGGGVWAAVGLAALPAVAQVAVAVVVYDLFLYWQHRLMHEVPFLWRFHAVHHSATRMSALAAIRNHALGPLVTACLSTAFAATGVPAEVFFVCQTFIMAKGWLQHANADLATGFLDRLFQTPRMHRWHHSANPAEEGTNFGFLTTVWDRVPWNRLPVVGPRLSIQRATYHHGSEQGPTSVGAGATTPPGSAFATWRHQFTAPLPSLDDALRVAAYPVVVMGTIGLFWALLSAGVPKWPLYLGHIALNYGLLKALERRIPYRGDWRSDSLEEGIDGAHFLLSTSLSHVARVASGFAIVALVGDAAHWVPFAGIWQRLGLDGAPVWVQFPIAMLVLDLAMYWHHRLMHGHPLLWRVHEVHHMTETFSPLRSLRNHPVGPFLTSVLMGSLLVAGIPEHVYLLCQATLVSVGLFHHVNADVRLGWLDHIVIGPKAHRWHHSDVPEEGNHNFGIVTTLGDRIPWHRVPLLGALLGQEACTFLMPEAGSPRRIGLTASALVVNRERSVLWNYVFQFAWPFQRRAVSAV